MIFLRILIFIIYLPHAVFNWGADKYISAAAGLKKWPTYIG